jgi:methionyl-tRNA formyltransferase
MFVGAVQEGRHCLEALIDRGEHFAGIVTLDSALGTSTWVPFDDLARDNDIPLLTVRDLNSTESVGRVAELRPDLILVIGWNRLLGAALLRLPALGVVGFHASLLPHYRGRAPVNWALINGERETGNTMFFLDEGVDTGDIIAQRRIKILDEDDCSTLYEKVSLAAIDMLDEHLPSLKKGCAPRISQNGNSATTMPKRRPEDGLIDWNRDARSLYNWVRAQTHPYPGAFTEDDIGRLYVWRASEVESGPVRGARPGTLVEGRGDEVHVATGDGGLLRLDRVQWAGGSEQSGSELRHLVGHRLGNEP